MPITFILNFVKAYKETPIAAYNIALNSGAVSAAYVCPVWFNIDVGAEGDYAWEYEAYEKIASCEGGMEEDTCSHGYVYCPVDGCSGGDDEKKCSHGEVKAHDVYDWVKHTGTYSYKWKDTTKMLNTLVLGMKNADGNVVQVDPEAGPVAAFGLNSDSQFKEA